MNFLTRLKKQKYIPLLGKPCFMEDVDNSELWTRLERQLASWVSESRTSKQG